jgi:hypothetical protein
MFNWKIEPPLVARQFELELRLLLSGGTWPDMPILSIVPSGTRRFYALTQHFVLGNPALRTGLLSLCPSGTTCFNAGSTLPKRTLS